jgi:hypothetical protein
VTTAVAKAPSTAAERLLALVPLALVYTVAAALYSWQVSRQRSPWIFPDESQYGHVAAAIAGTGSTAIAPIWGIAYPILLSPAWLDHNPVTAYDLAKYINVVLMCSTAVPAYLLARLVVRRGLALAAAVAALAIPGMAYASLLMQESLAYPFATLVLYLLASAIVSGSRRRLVLAFALALLGPFVRTELLVLPLIVLLAAAFEAWLSERARRARERWTAGRWAAAGAALVVVLALGTAIVVAASTSWRIALQHPGGLVRYAVVGVGTLVVGLAILPALSAPAAVVAARRERTVRAFGLVFVSAAVVFVLYVAGKETFISTRPGNHLVDLLGERNLIYLSPLLFAGTALWMQRRRASLAALVVATGALLLVLGLMPYPFAGLSSPHSPTAVAIGHIAHSLGWGSTAVRSALLLATAVAALLVWALSRPARPAGAALAAIAAAIVSWGLTCEIYASNMSRDIGRALVAAQPRPLDWVDRVTVGRPALYLGQGLLRAPELLSMAFWNPSITKLWSLQGTPARYIVDRTYVASADGRIHVPRGILYIVADREIEVGGQPIARGGRWAVYRVERPVRLRAYQAGVWEDGWMGSASSYTRFSGGRGRVLVDLSLTAWCGPDVGTRARVEVGRPVEGEHRLLLSRVTSSREAPLHACKSVTVAVPTPPPPFRVEVHAAPTFVPAELSSGAPDTRRLSTKVSYRFTARR